MTKKNTILCGKCKNGKSCFVLASGNRRCEFGGNITDQFTIKEDYRMAIAIKGGKMKKLVIILSGKRGKLGAAVANYCEEIDQEYLLFDEIKDNFEKENDKSYVVLYASNSDKFIEVFDFFLDNEIPLINGCTDVVFKQNLFDTNFYQLILKDGRSRGLSTKDEKIIIINAQNWDLPIVGFMAAMKKYGILIAYNVEKIEIKESHQASKKSIPGTAKNFAKGLGSPIENIFSEKDLIRQRLDWRIDPKFLDGNACHEINITYKNSFKKTGFYAKVMGRKDYAKGGLNIAKAVIQNIDKLQRGVYTIEDLVDLKIF